MLYHPQAHAEASPKAISGRTSYLRVRLAFHPYPQLIGELFNAHPFGPPQAFTPASPWPWIGHPVSGLQHVTGALFRLAFAPAPAHKALTICHIPQLAGSFFNRHALRAVAPRTACRHTVSGAISLRFRGAFHLSLTVLVRYRSLRVFSLGGWSPRIPTGFHVPRGTWVPYGSQSPFAYGVLTLYGGPFQAASAR